MFDIFIPFIDLVDNELKILSELVVTAAVGGNTKKLDGAYNDLLSRTNHMIEIASAVATHCAAHQWYAPNSQSIVLTLC